MENITVNQAVAHFIISALMDSKTKENPAMVAAIAELYTSLVKY
ncbi:hypothetical protein ACI3PH_05425 [Lactococcus lactis]